MRKISRLLLALLIASFFSSTKVLAEEVENQEVTEGEVVLATIGPDGNLEVIIEAKALDEDGSFTFGETEEEAEILEALPPGEPVFAVVQDPNGEGAQQVSCLNSKGDNTVDPYSTAIANAFFSFTGSSEDIAPDDVDAKQIEFFVNKMKDICSDVPPDETSTDSIQRCADAMSLKPDTVLLATELFNVDATDKLLMATQIADAAAPEGFNPLEGLPPEISDEMPAGSLTAGLIPPELIKKFTPKNFDFSATFGESVPPPGAFVGQVPSGSFIMPPGIQANSKVKFPDNVVFPQGVTIPKGFEMPASATLPPGIIIEDGFVPPAGLQFPPGAILPSGFDPTAFGATTKSSFTPPSGFTPPPGFMIADTSGTFALPEGFALPKGTELPNTARQFPAPTGFTAPTAPKGFDKQESIPAFETGFQFSAGAALPPAFDPSKAGLTPPPGFTPKEIGGTPSDFSQFKGDNFVPFDPNKGFDTKDSFGGFSGPPVDSSGAPVPGFFKPGELPTGTTAPPPISGTDPFAGAPKPTDTKNPPTGGGSLPPSGGSTTPPTGGSTQPPSGGGTTPPTGGSTQPPSGGGTTTPPPARRLDARIKTQLVGTLETAASTEITLAAPEGTDASKGGKITASAGVYLTGKVDSSEDSVVVPVIVDPSISADEDSVRITLSVDNEVESTSLPIDTSAIQLITQLDGNLIEVSTANTDVEFTDTSLDGYLLAPGTSALKMQKAISVKGTVVDADDGQVVRFTKPASAKVAGVYTLVFSEGANTYFGRVTIGTLKAKTYSGKVLAPNGQL